VPTDSAPITADERWSAEELALLEALPPALGGRIRTLLRDRDHYLALHAALIDVERATSLDERLRIFVHAIHSIGFGRVGIAIREGDHDGPRCIAVGMEQHDVLALSDLRHGGAEWGAGGTHVLPLTTPSGHPVATLVLGDPADEGSSALNRLRTIELFAQQVVHHIEQVRLSELTARQAERLQRLQVVGSAIARSLDEREISLEAARGVSQLIACDSVVIVHPDLERATVTPLVRLVGGVELPIAEAPLGDGVISRVARTGQPVLVAEPHPAASELIGADALVVGAATPVGSLLAVPLRVGLHLVAVLAVASSRRDAFADDDADLLLTMGAQAASALSNARQYAESQRERRQTGALADVARAVSESLRMGEVLRLIMRHAMSLLGAEGACVALRRDDYLQIVAAGGTGDLLAGLMLPVRSSIAGRAVLQQAPVISNAVPNDPDVSRQAQRLIRIRNTVVVPLSTARGVIGTLSVINRKTEFDQEDARVLQRLADHVAVAIVNARLYEELAESTREWTVAFNAIPTGMAVVDDDGRIVRYNSRALQLGYFETPHRELVGRQFFEAVLGDARGIEEGDPLWKALQDGVLGRATMRSETRNLLFDILASPHPNGGAVVTFDDVTAARALADEDRGREVALARSEARYTELVESASDAIFTVDAQGTFTSVNRALETATGRSRTALLGKHFSSVIDPRDREAMQAALGQTLAGKRQRHELRYLDRNGVSRHGSMLTSPIVDGESVTGVLGVVRDVSEEKLVVEQLVQQEKLAAIGQLVSGVAHELNNPLASVMAFSQLVLTTASDDAAREDALQTIHAEAKRAAKIVSNLLTFARQHPPQRTTTAVNEVISSVLEMRRYALAVHGVELHEKLDGSLPPIWADPFQLQQVLLNLVGNAEQALAGWEGEKRISVRSETRGGRIVVTVSDTGPGIPSAEIDRVFNPFYTTKGIGKGTGLGLSVSDGIIREHGGSIRVESVGRGASFIIELPIIAPPGAEPVVVAEPTVTASGSRPLMMLVVDDEPAIRSAIVRYFAGLGHTVDAAATGAEAHALLESRRYDALLLDVRMPDTSGDAIYRELIERDPAHAARVIFLTGDVQSDATQQFIDGTGRASVMKPFSFDELTRVVLEQGAR
jgi:PAS domain S-box-containing protein